MGQVTNIGSGTDISIGELADTILRLMGRDLPVVLDSARVRPDTSEVDKLQADATKAQDTLGWHPTISLEEGLIQTIQWIEENLSDFRIGTYAV